MTRLEMMRALAESGDSYARAYLDGLADRHHVEGGEDGQVSGEREAGGLTV